MSGLCACLLKVQKYKKNRDWPNYGNWRVMIDTMRLLSKPRFEILDGLRGVAALIVVVYHLFEVYIIDPCDQILNHGYFAVDFFFVLLGVVVGYAYDH